MDITKEWSVEEARKDFANLIQSVEKGEVHSICKKGAPTAVVISKDYFDFLLGRDDSLVSFFRFSPLVGLDLDLSRD